jgi:hypothetical protein
MNTSKPRYKHVRPKKVKPKAEKVLQRTMSVGELIAALKKFKSGMPVVSNGWITGLRVERCRVEEGSNYNTKAVYIVYEL